MFMQQAEDTGGTGYFCLRVLLPRGVPGCDVALKQRSAW